MKSTIRLVWLCMAMVMALAGCGKGERVITVLDDAHDKRIGVMTGAIGEEIAKTRFPKAEVKSFDDIMDGVAAIKSGQIDAIITALPTAINIAKRNPELQMLSERIGNEDTAVAIRKGDDQLLSDVNRVIAELERDGTLASMQQRWLKTDLSPYEEVNIAVPNGGKPIKVGVSATREPLSFVDRDGRVTGLDGELARRIGASLQRPVEFHDMKFMALIPALQSGKVDLIISGMNATTERKKSVNFSQAYFANAQVMIVRKPSGEQVKAGGAASKDSASGNELEVLQQTAGKKIAVMTGSTGEMTANAKFPKADIRRFDNLADTVVATKTGQADAALISYSSKPVILRAHPELRVLPERLLEEQIAMAVKKGNDTLLNDINRIIDELKADGTLAAMEKRWMKDDSSAYEVREIPAVKEGKALRVGVMATLEPFIFVDGKGRLAGHDEELARIIGMKLKRPVEFFDMNFTALIPALQSGKIDVIISEMTATDERRKSVDFTHPYFVDTQLLLVKKGGASAATSTAAKDTGSAAGAIANLEQIDGKRIGVLSGSAGDLAARKHFPQASFQVMNSGVDAALALKSHKVDAFVYDKSVLLNLVEKNPELVILEQPVAKLEVAAAIGKENTALLDEVNRALEALKKDGSLQRLRQKWVDSKDSASRQLPPTKREPAGKRGVLRIGTYAIYEPFSYQANGRIIGLDIELANLIGEKLGKRVDVTDMHFEALIPALQAGKIDLALSNFNVTDERKKLVNFSLPYIENDISVLVRKGEPVGGGGNKPAETVGSANTSSVKLTSSADLKGKRLGVLLGSVHDTYAMKHYPDATILQYKSPSDMVLAVKSGKVDASFYTRETLLEVLRNDDELGLVGDSLYAVPIGMGFNKGNDQLREQFNDFLKQIKQNGVYDDMVNRWIKQGNTAMPAIASSKTNGVLVVGTVSDKGLPFTVIKDGKLIGFDIELSQRFAAHIGKEIKFSDMEFGSLIAAVSTNKIDMIASTLMLTEERQKQIAFSDVYYEMGSNIFALKKNIVSKDAAAVAKPEDDSFFSGVTKSFHSNIIQENRYLLIIDGLKVTVLIAILSSIFGTALGALVCFMRMSSKAVLNIPAGWYISLLRGTPVLVLLMLIFYVVFASVDINPVLVAVIAFGMNFAAYAAEIFRTGIEGVDKGQTEAGIAMGFTKVNTFRHIVLPQAVRQILPVYKGEFISLVKMTSIVGYIAVQDLTKASDIIRSRTFDAFFPLVMVAILYFLISWMLTQSLEYMERRTDPKRKRKQAGKA
ncbi:MAG: amino acid transporter rane protein, family / amino acid transporter substrate-binding [Burkholderiaceae bacterium]|nr:amino acid transporter rane protein, family / amino acid transporter substrate-binding [Burkholderiaceae bacterium]